MSVPPLLFLELVCNLEDSQHIYMLLKDMMSEWTSLRVVKLSLGIGMGNPGVFQGYLHPYPRKPVPVDRTVMQLALKIARFCDFSPEIMST